MIKKFSYGESTTNHSELFQWLIPLVVKSVLLISSLNLSAFMAGHSTVRPFPARLKSQLSMVGSPCRHLETAIKSLCNHLCLKLLNLSSLTISIGRVPVL